MFATQVQADKIIQWTNNHLYESTVVNVALTSPNGFGIIVAKQNLLYDKLERYHT